MLKTGTPESYAPLQSESDFALAYKKAHSHPNGDWKGIGGEEIDIKNVFHKLNQLRWRGEPHRWYPLEPAPLACSIDRVAVWEPPQLALPITQTGMTALGFEGSPNESDPSLTGSRRPTYPAGS